MSKKSTTEVLKRLRNVMKNTNYVCQKLQAYIVPSYDAHQSEFITAHDERRQFISGFTGSAATAIIAEEQAGLWTDGRYFLQAEKQLDENWILMKEGVSGTPTFGEFLNNVLPVGGQVGVDPFLFPYNSWKTLQKELDSKGNSLVPVEQNLIDVIWEAQPDYPKDEIYTISEKYSGKSWQEKVLDVQKKMESEKATTLVVTALDEVAWLFNLRGSDIQFNPVFYSYCIVTLSSVYLFAEKERFTQEARASLENMGDIELIIYPYDSVTSTLKTILDDKEGGNVWIGGKSSCALVNRIPHNKRLLKTNPVSVMKCLKNEVEIECAKRAHIKDAAALCQYFFWLSTKIADGNISEIDGANELERLRKMQKDYAGPSFETVSSSGPHGAIIHYRPSQETDRKLTTEEIYLCDSGGQYRDGGTTDVTRTFHFGTPSEFEKLCYTLVLKGHISLSSAIFPNLTLGHRIDSFARRPLWESGLDYMHGTGHGVGAFLNVHEGPSGISYVLKEGEIGLEEGMIMSIEPGFYVDEKFGIRLENLAFIKAVETTHNYKDTRFLTFEPLTFVPFQTKFIDPSLLTGAEIEWLNSYHTTCREIVGKVLEEEGKTEALSWLFKETEPLG